MRQAREETRKKESRAGADRTGIGRRPASAGSTTCFGRAARPPDSPCRGAPRFGKDDVRPAVPSRRRQARRVVHVHHSVGNSRRAARQRGVARLGSLGHPHQELQPAENLRPEEQYTLFHPSEIELGDLSRNVFEAVETIQAGARGARLGVGHAAARAGLAALPPPDSRPEAVLRRPRLHAAAAERNRRQRHRSRTFRASRTASSASNSRCTTSASCAGGSRSQSCAAWRTSADSTISGFRPAAFASSRGWKTGGRAGRCRRRRSRAACRRSTRCSTTACRWAHAR